MMTSPKTGEILKYQRTGGLFEVRQVTNEFVILCARDGSSQIMTGKGSFDFLFARVPPLEFTRKDLRAGSKYPLLAGGLAF
jgi:hypothetical protein